MRELPVCVFELFSDLVRAITFHQGCEWLPIFSAYLSRILAIIAGFC